MRIVENSRSCLRLQETSGFLPALLLAAAAILVIVVIGRHVDPRQLINAALFAIAAAFFRRSSRIVLDKPARHCRIRRLDMWRQSQRDIKFDDITDVRVQIMRPDTSVQVHTRLLLATSSGDVPLSAGYRANLDQHIALRETIVDVIFSGRARPAPLEARQLLIDAGRPMAAVMRS
jgi:hypothetical protein